MSVDGDPPGGPPKDAGEPEAPPTVVVADDGETTAAVDPKPIEPATVDVTADDDSIATIAASIRADDDLQDAVGARRRKPRPVTEDEPVDDDGLPDEQRRKRRMIMVMVLALVVGLGVAALVLLGRINTARYFLSCKTSQAVAEQGRAFPPWGSSPLPGAEWKPIALPPSAQCQPREVDDRGRLEALYLDLLLERASEALSARTMREAAAGADAKASLETVSMQLEQALLLSRGPDRGDQRKQVERLAGDVVYWRAAARLRDATTALAEAARQYDQAALARPLHVSDAGAWAELVRRLVEELGAGPNGTPALVPGVIAPTGTGAPPGTALPVEPTPSGADAEPAAPTPDAGVPTGGVLL